MKLTDLVSKFPKILIYGPPGSGKTGLCLTLGARCEYWDLDDNLEVGFGLNDNLKQQRLQVEVKQFLEPDPKKASAFAKIRAYSETVVQLCARNQYPYDAIVVDSLTALAAASEDNTMAAAGRIEQAPEIQHWGKLLKDVENFISNLRALPKVVFFVAHDMEAGPPTNLKTTVAVPGKKLPGRVTRMFNEIWYVGIKPAGGGKYEFYIQTAPTSSITCRSGRGLANATIFASNTNGVPGTSVSLWEILNRIYKPSATPTPTPTPTTTSTPTTTPTEPAAETLTAPVTA